jgi:hypothetical protein
MIEFFRAGGFPMIFVLLFGALALAAAVRFALRPDALLVDAVRALSAATLLSVGSGTFSDIAAVCSKVPARWAHHPKIHLIVMQGIGESMSPGILGFSLLSVAWLVTAVGHRRLRALGPG